MGFFYWNTVKDFLTNGTATAKTKSLDFDELRGGVNPPPEEVVQKIG